VWTTTNHLSPTPFLSFFYSTLLYMKYSKRKIWKILRKLNVNSERGAQVNYANKLVLIM
jgi:hypothetical protein